MTVSDKMLTSTRGDLVETDDQMSFSVRAGRSLYCASEKKYTTPGVFWRGGACGGTHVLDGTCPGNAPVQPAGGRGAWGAGARTQRPERASHYRRDSRGQTSMGVRVENMKTNQSEHRKTNISNAVRKEDVLKEEEKKKDGLMRRIFIYLLFMY